MKYRSFRNYDFKPSALGLGCMRLPNEHGVGNRNSDKINEAEAIKLIRYAIDNGINYIDTAYNYHAFTSEKVVGKALKDGYREKVLLTTKSPVWLIKTPEDFNKYLEEQLQNLQTDYIDFYFLHALNYERWSVVQKLDLIKKAEEAKSNGKIKKIGFSFHDKTELFFEILNGYDKWDFCMLQINYVDTNYHGGLEAVKKAYEKGLDIIVMEPLQGGKLAKLPENFKQVLSNTGKQKDDVEWAFNYLWNMKEVSLLISGMSAMEHVTTGIQYASNSHINMLQSNEVEAIEKVGQKFKELQMIPCTKCNYCMPCPKGVNIPPVLELYNDLKVRDEKLVIESYRNFPDMWKADKCVNCKLCEKMCPQHIKIGSEMNTITKFFENKI